MHDLEATNKEAMALLGSTFELKGLMHDDHLLVVLRYTHSRKPLAVATIKQEPGEIRKKTINFFTTAREFRFARFSRPFLDLLLKLPPGPPSVTGPNYVDDGKKLRLFVVVGYKDRFDFLYPYWKNKMGFGIEAPPDAPAHEFRGVVLEYDWRTHVEGNFDAYAPTPGSGSGSSDGGGGPAPGGPAGPAAPVEGGIFAPAASSSAPAAAASSSAPRGGAAASSSAAAPRPKGRSGGFIAISSSCDNPGAQEHPPSHCNPGSQRENLQTVVPVEDAAIPVAPLVEDETIPPFWRGPGSSGRGEEDQVGGGVFPAEDEDEEGRDKEARDERGEELLIGVVGPSPVGGSMAHTIAIPHGGGLLGESSSVGDRRDRSSAQIPRKRKVDEETADLSCYDSDHDFSQGGVVVQDAKKGETKTAGAKGVPPVPPQDEDHVLVDHVDRSSPPGRSRSSAGAAAASGSAAASSSSSASRAGHQTVYKESVSASSAASNADCEGNALQADNDKSTLGGRRWVGLHPSSLGGTLGGTTRPSLGGTLGGTTSATSASTLGGTTSAKKTSSATGALGGKDAKPQERQKTGGRRRKGASGLGSGGEEEMLVQGGAPSSSAGAGKSVTQVRVYTHSRTNPFS